MHRLRKLLAGLDALQPLIAKQYGVEVVVGELGR